jgi:sec-independent protein translocase protein TatA
MFGPIGMQELIIIFVIALIVFGPRKLPELGKSLGKSIAEFKRASNELRSTLEQEIRVEETRRDVMEPIETVRREANAAVEGAKAVADSVKKDGAAAPATSNDSAEKSESASDSAASSEAASSTTAEVSGVTGAGEPQETKA